MAREPAQRASRFEGVRQIEEHDREAMFDLAVTAYHDAGFGGFSPAAVREVIDLAIKRESYHIVLIRGPERVEASLGLQPSRHWYGDAASWWYSDLLVYVHPSHRRSRHFSKLMQYAMWFEATTGIPVVLGLKPRVDMERKAKAFARYGRPVAQVFLIGSGEFRYMDRAPSDDAGDKPG